MSYGGPATLLSSSGGLSGQYQKWFDRKFLTTVLQKLVMDQFGQVRPLPRQAGVKTVTFTRPPAPSTAYTQSDTTPTQKISSAGADIIGTEGSYSGMTDRSFSWTHIDAVLTTQLGKITSFSDILSETALFDTLKGITTVMAHDAAHAVDFQITASLMAATSGSDTHITERFSGLTGTGATWANLAAAAPADSVLSIQDLLGAQTALTIARAPEASASSRAKGARSGDYVAVVGPQAAYNIKLDPKFIETGYRGVNKGLFTGELGEWYGIRIILGTQPFVEDSASTQYTYASAPSGDAIYATIVQGAEAFGVVDLASQSPFAPKIYVVTTPDSNNPIMLFSTVGWKAWFIVKRLKNDWAVAVRSKTTYA